MCSCSVVEFQFPSSEARNASNNGQQLKFRSQRGVETKKRLCTNPVGHKLLCQTLPDNLYIKGDLYLNNSKITKLPNQIIVDGDIHIRGTQITSIPDNAKIKGRIIN